MKSFISKKDRMEKHTLISRKKFLKATALSLMAAAVAPVSGFGFGFGKEPEKQKPFIAAGKNSLRSIEYNIFNGAIGYKGINGRQLPDDEKYELLKTARSLGQIPRRLALQLALYDPDLVTFCEGPKKEAIVRDIAKWLNIQNYAFFPGAKNGKGNYPGCILTRYEIISSENRPFVDKANNDPKELFTRHWGKVNIRLPNGEIMVVHTAHLYPFTANGGRQVRFSEIHELVKAMQRDSLNNTRSVLLQGDMNLTPAWEGYKKLIGGGLIDTFAEAGDGKGYTATSRDPHERIDFIFALGPLSKQIKASRRLYEGAFRMNNSDPKAFDLSDHIPVMTDFKL